jgi:mercuric ion transport protein
MDNAERPAGRDGAGKRTGYLMAVLAMLSCPCHFPILLLLLSGTAAGALLAGHQAAVLLALTVVFIPALAVALKLLRRNDTDAA